MPTKAHIYIFYYFSNKQVVFSFYWQVKHFYACMCVCLDIFIRDTFVNKQNAFESLNTQFKCARLACIVGTLVKMAR